MRRDPNKRLGSGPRDAGEIKAHPFFKGIIWADVYKRKVEVPKPIITKDEGNKENIWIPDVPAVEGIDKIEGWDFLAQQSTFN